MALGQVSLTSIQFNLFCSSDPEGGCRCYKSSVEAWILFWSLWDLWWINMALGKVSLTSIQFNLFCSSDPEGGCNPQDIEHVNYI